MVSPSAMACWMRATARSMSFIRRGERVSFRSRSSFSAAASGVVTLRAASTEASSPEYPAERRASTALRSASPMFHFLYFTKGAPSHRGGRIQSSIPSPILTY